MQQEFLRELTYENIKIKPLFFGKEKCDPCHRCGSHVRKQYLIHYVESGKGRFTVGEKEYEVSAGGMFFISPGEVTIYEADGKDPWVYKWVGFECGFDIGDIFCKNVVFSERCSSIFDDILESEKYGDSMELFVAGKILELIARLRKRISTPQRREHSYAQKAKNYIDANYYKPITVAGIAKELGLDRSYLSTVFKELTGQSPKEYIVDYRLGNAAELMTVYDFSPKQAAISCGYEDIFNFSKMFKRKYGMSPRDYKLSRSRAENGTS